VEPTGTAHVLDGSAGVAELVGRSGFGLAPAQLVSDPVPLQPGARLRQVNVQPRPILLPLFVQGSTPAEFRQRRDAVAQWFSPTRGDGRLQHTRPDGTVREVVCRCQQLDWAENEQSATPLSQDAVATLVAHDPYWYSTIDALSTYTLGAPAGNFLTNPFFPLNLSNATVLAHALITNPGDVDAWPVWTIHGPGDDPSLINGTTGERITLFSHFIIGQTVVIDTRPGIKSVSDALGTNLVSILSNDTTLFPLVPGLNRVEIQLGNATAASSVTLSYAARFVSA
jgi:hypothetical protein